MRDSIPATPNKTKRIEYIDAMRGFTMFLVVLMHVAARSLNVYGYEGTPSFHRFFFLVRMPMFFLISGFVLYKARVAWNTSHIVAFFKKKIPVQLIGPFIFFLAYVNMKGFSFVNSIFLPGKSGYWFTYVLFIYFVFYAVVRFCIRNNRWSSIVLIVMGLCMLPCSWPPLKNYIPVPARLLDLLSFQHWHFFLFFVLGTLVKKHFDVVQTWLDGKWLLTGSILFFFLVEAFRDYIPVEGYIMGLPLTLTGLVIMFSFFRKKQKFFSHETKVGRVFLYVGRRTLDIYLIHYFLIPDNLNFVTVFTEHPMPVIEVTVSAIISIIIISFCLLIGNIIRLSPFLAHWMFGAKTT